MVWPVLNPDIHAAVIEFTKTRSHRVMAVVGGAIIEEARLRALDHRMRAPSKQNEPSFGGLAWARQSGGLGFARAAAPIKLD
jgi:hypothetical protein